MVATAERRTTPVEDLPFLRWPPFINHLFRLGGGVGGAGRRSKYAENGKRVTHRQKQ